MDRLEDGSQRSLYHGIHVNLYVNMSMDSLLTNKICNVIEYHFQE